MSEHLKPTLAPTWFRQAVGGILLLSSSSAPAAGSASATATSPVPVSLVAGMAVGAVIALGGWGARQRAKLVEQHVKDTAELKAKLAETIEDESAKRKELQEKLEESLDLGLRQERLVAVGQLAGGLAHEFNNILTIIQGHAALLMDGPELDEESKKSVTHIAEGVERITALVKQMLAFSRKQVMQQQTIRLAPSADEFADILKRLLGAHIVLKMEIPAALPAVHVDPGMLQQIIANLAVNARDVMSSGGTLTINAHAVKVRDEDVDGKPDRHPGEFVILTMVDTGPGIDAAVIERLFEPFFTTKDVGKGTGLGLATSYGMAKQNGGWIEVDSTIGIGTSFHVYLPVAPGEALSSTARPPKPAGGETVLVVEDEVMLRELVREILEANRFHVLDAGSGREALEVWSRHKDQVDLLLTDMSMPDGMSGSVLAEKIQAENPKLPVIFSSGYNDHLTASQSRQDPRHQFLVKPYHPADLAQAVRSSLDRAASAAKDRAA